MLLIIRVNQMQCSDQLQISRVLNLYIVYDKISFKIGSTKDT